jgi:hypothetical protein
MHPSNGMQALPTVLEEKNINHGRHYHTASLTSLSGRAARASGKSLDSVDFIALIAPELSVYHRHHDEVSHLLLSFKLSVRPYTVATGQE